MIHNLFMAYDGDNAGSQVGLAVLHDDAAELHAISKRIAKGHRIVKGWVEKHGGQTISGGGDEGTFIVPDDCYKDIESLRKEYKEATGLSITVGVGQTLSQAGKALIHGKLTGKDKVVRYDPSLESRLEEAHRRVESGEGSEEDKKQDESYLSKLPKGSEKVMKKAEPMMEKKPKEQFPDGNAPAPQSPSDTGAPAAGEQLPPAGGAPGDDGLPEVDMNANSADVDAAANGTPIGEYENGKVGDAQGDNPEESEFGDLQDLQDLSDEDLMAELGDEVGQPPEGAPAPAIGDDGAPMDPNAPEEPGEHEMLQRMLSEGTDDEAQMGVDQLKSKIAGVLESFKANKDMLEQIQQQNPELYDATLQMLRSMIIMGKMLGMESPENAAAPAAGAPPAPGAPPAGAPPAAGAPPMAAGAPPAAKPAPGAPADKGDKPFPPKKDGEKPAPKGEEKPKSEDKGESKDKPKSDDKPFPPKKDEKPKAPAQA